MRSGPEHKQIPDAALRRLRREAKGDLHTDPVWRGAYSCDGSNYMIMPLGVFVPRDADDVALAIEAADPAPALADAVRETMQSVLKLRGEVQAGPLGSLPNDGKVIDDIRKFD